MTSNDRRAAGRRRAWGRGPVILRFEPLEGRQLLAANAKAGPLPDLVGTALTTVPSADWNDTIEVKGGIANLGKGPVPSGAYAGIYASPTLRIGPGSQLIGVVTIKTGLMPGETQYIDQTVTLPPSALASMKSTKLWLGLRLDPQGVIAESNKLNNEGRGLGVDQTTLTITPKKPPFLQGTSFALNTTQAFWGQPITITAQVANTAQGDAPATRAKIVLTPSGLMPGTSSDVTIGNIMVPALPAFQRANLVQTITLPSVPPSSLFGQGSYLISMIQDADQQASLAVQQPKIQGIGLDSAILGIAPVPNTTFVQGAKPDLAATGVVAPTTPIYWGQTVQLDTTVQNISAVNAPEFKVRFYLTGVNGVVEHSIFLGQADLPNGLAANTSQDILQTVSLPSRLPYGFNVASIDYGRIVAVIDPENQIDETLKTNNVATSNPVTLYVLNTDGTSTVPTLPPIRQNAPVATPSTSANPATAQNPTVPIKRGSYRVPPHKKENPIIHKITNYPNQFNNFFKSLSLNSKSK